MSAGKHGTRAPHNPRLTGWEATLLITLTRPSPNPPEGIPLGRHYCVTALLLLAQIRSLQENQGEELLSPGPLALVSRPLRSLVALSLGPREQGEEVEDFQRALCAVAALDPFGMESGQQESQAVMRTV